MNIITMNNKKKGFTLIELLVVIAIIGVLASVVLVSINSARTKAQDATRKAEMRQIESALSIHLNDLGFYPNTGGQWWSYSVTYGSRPLEGPTGYIPGLAPTYISELPVDPAGVVAGVPDGGYLYRSDGVNFKLLSHRLPSVYPTAGEAFYDPIRPTWAYALCSDPATCLAW